MTIHPDTIVALSSPAGRSPRALLRLSGPAADEVLALMAGVAVDELPPVRVMAAMKIDIGLGADRLPCLAVRFAAPRSFTGEAMVELQIPGNPALVDRVLHRCISCLPPAKGVRLAHAGEFSLRSYLHRKIDLTQAEGIAATIAAQTDAQLAAATLLRKGRLGDWSRELVTHVAEALAMVEAGIDFTDQEDVVPIAPRELEATLNGVAERLDELLSRSRSWGALQTLPRVVLVGEPSAGKSTLFNALLQRDRAVTSPTPGTTRDVLEETIDLPATPASPIAIRVSLIDIAGLDHADAQRDGQLAIDIQNAAQNAIATADLILQITPTTRLRFSSPNPNPSPNPPPALKFDPDNKPILHVQSKSDTPAQRDAAPHGSIAISALNNTGLDELRHAIANALASATASLTAETLALQPRHEDALRSARASLADAIARVTPQRDNRALAGPELIAGALRQTLDALACLGGEMTPDDVIGLVFARFCVGK